MEKLFVGVDNGLQGSIVGIDVNQDIVFKRVMPTIDGKKSKKLYDVRTIVELFREKSQNYKMYVVLEKAFVKGMVSGRVACFSTGYGFGLMQGILESLQISYTIVSPQEWQKVIFAGLAQQDTKQASILFCQRKYPNEVFTATERSTKIHDGLTDGLSMAVYSYRMNMAKE